MPSVPAKNKGGDCYKAAADYVIDHAFRSNGKKGLVLVHGEVTGQGAIDGVQYGHAWVEDGSTAIDVSNGRNINMPKPLYYAIGRIGKTIRYTPEQMREKILKHKHFGPW